MRRAPIVVLAALALCGLLALAVPSIPSSARQATPVAATPAPVVIASEVLVRATPAAVDDAELGLGRVTIMPGAAIPPHYHPGTQIAVIVQGTLTYSVFTGEVLWTRADRPDDPPVAIGPGETVQIGVGDALVETSGSIHQGRNDGAVPVVIYLSTLFPADAPRAIVTPVPAS